MAGSPRPLLVSAYTCNMIRVLTNMNRDGLKTEQQSLNSNDFQIAKMINIWAASCEKGPDDMTRDFE